MAYAQPRSANRELEQGLVDGAYKQLVKDRGGVVEPCTTRNHEDLSATYYGVCEAPVFNTPDGQTMTSVYAQYGGGF